MELNSGGVMNAMMKLQSQLTMVDNAIPLPLARKGNISAPSNQGTGPQLLNS